ncbi:hypothetical protein O3G_MSEX014369 [Manduca sexta]|uniref:Nose resistant-to-fluoxetine protein N-terminal domain-containing protein n=1 Tax=Manduca sexta TaxID=7130 RepID=A0A922CZX6_MANSE|nr:hypothetical protein O3G_MSEX014369 [Manduca sexta]
MNVLCVALLCLCLFIHDITATSNIINTKNKGKEKTLRTDVDNVIEQLGNEKWEPNETPCVEKTLQLLHNVKNFTLWAVWIWDSIQQPVGILYGSRTQLGNYDQCLKSKGEFRTQYCLADIKLTDPGIDRQEDVNIYGSAELYLKTPSKYGRDFTSITWGVCLPEQCHPESVSKILKILFRRSYFSPLTNSSITVTSCETGESLQYSTGFYVFM